MRRVLDGTCFSALPLLLGGCAADIVGTYRIEDAAMLAASCTGVETERASVWAEAMAAHPPEDLSVGRVDEEGGRGQPDDPAVARFVRADSGLVRAPVEAQEGGLWSGEGDWEDGSVAELALGADFAALLHGDGEIGCRLALHSEAELEFRDERRRDAAGRVGLEVTQAAVPEGGCSLLRCAVEWSWEARHTGLSNQEIY
jgi:hypothetical protein